MNRRYVPLVTAAGAILMVLLSGTFETARLYAQDWRVRSEKDAFTDVQRREACNQDSGKNTVCLWFEKSKSGHVEFWMLLRLSDIEARSLDTQRIPWTRVDSNEVHDDKLIETERLLRTTLIPRRAEPRWIMWRQMTQINPGDQSWIRNRSGSLWQFLNGRTLRIRALLVGGFQKDTEMSLGGLKPVLKEVSPVPLE